MDIHVVNIAEFKITRDGRLYTSDNAPGVTIKDALTFRTEFRVIPADDVPNSAGKPTIKDYLKSEIAAGYQFAHMSQNILITQKLS